jgi:hypothetical protein
LGIPVLAPALRTEYALTLPEVGLVIAAVNVGSVVTLLPWGLLADRIGERFVLATGLIGASTGLVLAAFASSFSVFIAAIAVAGALGAGVNAASGRAVMGWFEERQRGFALGIRQTAVPLGGMSAALALPPIAAAWGLRGGLVALACGCFVASLAGLSGLREAPRDRRGTERLRSPPQGRSDLAALHRERTHPGRASEHPRIRRPLPARRARTIDGRGRRRPGPHPAPRRRAPHPFGPLVGSRSRANRPTPTARARSCRVARRHRRVDGRAPRRAASGTGRGGCALAFVERALLHRGGRAGRTGAERGRPRLSADCALGGQYGCSSGLRRGGSR